MCRYVELTLIHYPSLHNFDAHSPNNYVTKAQVAETKKRTAHAQERGREGGI